MRPSLIKPIISSSTSKAFKNAFTSSLTPVSARSLSSCTSILNNQAKVIFLPRSFQKSTVSPSISKTLFTLRPYHVSIRTLDQHNRDSSSPTDTPDEKSLADKDEPHIQPQHSNPMPPNTDPNARMLIGFTCTVCNHRLHKTMSKHSYNHGVVIMQCDSCKNRHLIADHLGWFKNGGVTVEDLVKEKGETVQKLSRDYQLVKDGELSSGSGTNVTDSAHTESSTLQKSKTELELALEKAAMGTIEWIPKDILRQEEERMKKSQEAIDSTKKQ